MRQMRFPWWLYLTLLVVLVLFGLAPLLGVVVADAVASANGCNLGDGPNLVCVVGGSDWGPALYAVAALTWFLLATMPLAGGALIVWLVVLVIHWVAFARRQKLEQA
jgi:hypothetical protein